MSDRLQEIRSRLDAATVTGWYDQTSVQALTPWSGVVAEMVAHAPADIAWLLDEVERLERENAFDVLEITRKASDAEDYWMQEAKRLAAEVERLRNTNLSVSQPLCDGAADA